MSSLPEILGVCVGALACVGLVALLAIVGIRVLRTGIGRAVLGLVSIWLLMALVVVSGRETEVGIAFFILVYLAIPTVPIVLSRRWKRLAARRIRVEDQSVVVRSLDGEILGSIDLTRPYRIVPHPGYGHATYTLEQDGARVLFCTASDGASTVVPQVFGLEFPPFMRMAGL